MSHRFTQRSSKFFAVLFLAAAPLTACGDSDNLDEPVLTTESSSEITSSESSSETPSNPPSESSSEKPAEDTSHQAEEPKEEPAPTFVKCQGDNTALMSDGSVITDTTNCGAPEPAEPECTGGAAECGYGHDEQGNRNPSSGELQTQWGCEQGYITDPELCAAVSGL